MTIKEQNKSHKEMPSLAFKMDNKELALAIRETVLLLDGQGSDICKESLQDHLTGLLEMQRIRAGIVEISGAGGY